MEREVEALRRDPSVLNGLGVTEVVDHYDRIIRGLDTPPVIMGHSFGGLITGQRPLYCATTASSSPCGRGPDAVGRGGDQQVAQQARPKLSP